MRVRHNFNISIKLRDKIALSIVLVFLTTVYFFLLLNKTATPILLDYAELETTKISSLIINKAVQNQVDDSFDIDELIITTKNESGEIISVDFNTNLVNRALNSITNIIQANLKLLEEGNLELLDLPEDYNTYELEKSNDGLLYYIPFGVVTDIPLIADLGPKIPVKTSLIGSVKSNVRTDLTNYGINNALLKVYIEVEVSEQVILPFVSKRINTKLDIPVAIKLINGSVPKVYGGSISSASPIVGIE